MHWLMLTTAALLTAWWRRIPQERKGTPSQRWERSLLRFAIPPMLLLATAGAIACMGAEGEMIGMPASGASYVLALACLASAIGALVYLTIRGGQAWRQARSYPLEAIASRTVRVIESEVPFSAQVGIWRPELVVTRGLLDLLDEAHLDAVLAHEEAHARTRDTFWFFWLGWLRICTRWLPQTEALWHELLLLRELRADAQAANNVDPLLLAESLLEVARYPVQVAEELCAPLSCSAPPNRLQERIEALLAPSGEAAIAFSRLWRWFAIVLLPFLTLPLHAP